MILEIIKLFDEKEENTHTKAQETLKLKMSELKQNFTVITFKLLLDIA